MSKSKHTASFLGWNRVAQKNDKTPLVDRALNLLLKKKQEKEDHKKTKGHFSAPLSRVKHLLPF